MAESAPREERGTVGMLDRVLNTGLALVFAVVLAWMLLTLATGATLNGLL